MSRSDAFMTQQRVAEEREHYRKLASWYALLARAGSVGQLKIEDGFIYTMRTGLNWRRVFQGRDFDDNGLPLEKPELRAALEKALDQPGETP